MTLFLAQAKLLLIAALLACISLQMHCSMEGTETLPINLHDEEVHRHLQGTVYPPMKSKPIVTTQKKKNVPMQNKQPPPRKSSPTKGHPVAWGPVGPYRDIEFAMNLRKAFGMKRDARNATMNDVQIMKGLKKTAVRNICIPNLFLGGFPDSGSVYLYRYLERHSQIAVGKNMEPHFLARHFRHENNSNAAHDGFSNYFDNYTKAKACQRVYENENSTGYILDGSQSLVWDMIGAFDHHMIHDLPVFLKHFVPDAKFIFVKSNPVTRTTEDYFYFKDHIDVKKLPNVFELSTKVRNSINHLEKCFQTSPGCCCAYFPPRHARQFPRLHVSLYECHIERFRSVFGPDQVLVLDSVPLEEKAFKLIFEFLGIKEEPIWASELEDKRAPHDKPTQATVQQLTTFFKQYGDSHLLDKHTGGFRTYELMNYCHDAARNSKK